MTPACTVTISSDITKFTAQSFSMAHKHLHFPAPLSSSRPATTPLVPRRLSLRGPLLSGRPPALASTDPGRSTRRGYPHRPTNAQARAECSALSCRLCARRSLLVRSAPCAMHRSPPHSCRGRKECRQGSPCVYLRGSQHAAVPAPCTFPGSDSSTDPVRPTLCVATLLRLYTIHSRAQPLLCKRSRPQTHAPGAASICAVLLALHSGTALKIDDRGAAGRHECPEVPCDGSPSCHPPVPPSLRALESGAARGRW